MNLNLHTSQYTPQELDLSYTVSSPVGRTRPLRIFVAAIANLYNSDFSIISSVRYVLIMVTTFQYVHIYICVTHLKSLLYNSEEQDK